MRALGGYGFNLPADAPGVLAFARCVFILPLVHLVSIESFICSSGSQICLLVRPFRFAVMPQEGGCRDYFSSGLWTDAERVCVIELLVRRKLL